MPVTDFECQIARGQIGRYLGGGALSPEAMRGLEDHLAECPECKTILSDRRAALLGMLGGDLPTKAVVSMPVAEENPLVAALRAKQEQEMAEAPKPKVSPRYAKAEAPAEKATKPVMTKPLMLGGLLAAVLIGMNFMSRANDGKGAFGSRAADAFAADTLAKNDPTKPAATTTTNTPSSRSAPAIPDANPPATVTVPASLVASTTNPAATTTPAVEPPKTEAATPPPTETPKTVETPKVEAPKAEAPKPGAPKPEAPKPVAAPVEKPVEKVEAKPIVHKRTARKHVVRKRTVRAKRSSQGSVRVYGLDGHPLN